MKEHKSWVLAAIYGSDPWIRMNPPASEAQIRSCQARIGLQFSPSFREFLLLSNGGSAGGAPIYGVPPLPREFDLVADRESALRFWPAYRNWVPLATDGCGNDFVLVVDAGKSDGEIPIGFVEKAEDPTRIDMFVASNYWSFLHFWLRLMAGDKDVIKGVLLEEPPRPWPWDEHWLKESDPGLSQYL